VLAAAIAAFGLAARAQSSVPDSPAPSAPAPQATPTAKPHSGDKFGFPEQAKPAPAPAPAAEKKSGGDDFPFPGEDAPASPTPSSSATSKHVADSSSEPPAPPPDKGFSSSRVRLDDEGSGSEAPAPDPKRVKEDESVANLYWNLGNYEGAYLRYKDAVVYAPQNAEDWFHLAETERMLGKNVKAREDYGRYLVLSPNGSRIHEVAKRLQELPKKDKPQPQGPGPRLP
jgi:tetratricopeptide (TPR) repeat protein